MAKENGIFTARYGGDEFVVIYEGLSKEAVEENVKKLRDTIYKANWEHLFSLSDDRVTISQGICYGTPDGAATLFAYLQLADEMLYEVKQESRNNYKICDAAEKRTK